MMGGMGGMMKNMGKPPPKQLYPTLMALPELSPEQRTEVEHAAAERMHAGPMQLVRQRRLATERYVRALDPEMYRDGSYAHLSKD